MKKLGLLQTICMVLAFCAATAIASPAQILTTLHSFAGQPTDGAYPYAVLIQATDGNFYGTTGNGGANSSGTVFRLTPAGALTTLYSFCPQPGCADGEDPFAGLVQATDGNFYGTADAGGTHNGNCLSGCGTIFEVTAGGKLTTLHSFDASDGAFPSAGLVQASDGNFYGTTWGGGTYNAYCPYGCGTVFEITPSGTLTTLHSFAGYPTDGASPHAGLIQANDGNLYGTTEFGGASGSCSIGCGTVFKITASGRLTMLHSFDSSDGGFPTAGLV